MLELVFAFRVGLENKMWRFLFNIINSRAHFVSTSRSLTTSIPQNVPKKAVFITGCDSGFGFSLATHMLENSGAEGKYRDFVVIAGCYYPNGYSNGAEKLRETATLKTSNLHLLKIDVTSSESLSKARDSIAAICDKGDVQLWALVNNAATLAFADAVFQTEEMFRKQFDVNVIGAWALSKALTPLLMESGGGRIVNMISFCTTCPLPTLAVYTSTKAALLRLSEGMRAELLKFGVDVVLFNPGDHPGSTPLCAYQEGNFNSMEPEVRAAFGSKHPGAVEYFEGIRDKFCNQFPAPDLAKLDDPEFYKQADKALTDGSPKHFYVNSPWATRLFFWLVDKLPSAWGDRARIAIMMLPK